MTEPIEPDEPDERAEPDDPRAEPDDSELDPRARRRWRRCAVKPPVTASARRKPRPSWRRSKARRTIGRTRARRGGADRQRAAIDGEDVWRIRPMSNRVGRREVQLQPDRVREAVQALAQSKPHLAKAATPPPTDRPVEGLRAGASPEPRKTEVAWQSVLRRGRMALNAREPGARGRVPFALVGDGSPILCIVRLPKEFVWHSNRWRGAILTPAGRRARRPAGHQRGCQRQVSTVIQIGTHDLRIPVVYPIRARRSSPKAGNPGHRRTVTEQSSLRKNSPR